MRFAIIPALLFNLCGTSGGRVGEVVGEVHQGEGWSMRLPAVGAQVKVDGDAISVDTPDFSRFYDIRWGALNPVDLGQPVKEQALTDCDPAVWDEPVITETTWTASALCTRRERFEWLIGRVERHGDRALVFFYVANRDFIAYEDAWVDFANTAASLSAQATPPAPHDSRALRRAIREGAKNVGPSKSPLPGGRVMSAAIVPVLDPVWAQRATLPPPPRPFGPAAEAPAP